MSEFVKATLIRAIRTMAQTAIATIGTAMVVSDVNWLVVLSASVLAGILSILTSIATGLPEVQSAEEVKYADVISEPVVPYEDTANYDYLFIDDNVDEGEDDEVE